MTSLRTRAALAALAAFGVVPSLASAQNVLDKLEVHGSLNAAYGRSDSLPVYGVPRKATSDYRVFTLQGRFNLDDKNTLVAQVFNRRLGTSPLAGAISDVTMQWAFWQHRQGGFTFKAGRNPLPRGLLNEVRYIGTVLPFFRPPTEMQLEAFDALDGVVASYRHDLPLGMSVEQYGFFGGSENRSVATTATGQDVRIARTENMFGGQNYLTFPFANLRLGLYGARYGFIQATSRGYRSNVVASGEASVGPVKAQHEFSRITGYGPLNDNRSGYTWLTVRTTDRVSLAGQHAFTNRKLYAKNPALNEMYPDVKTWGAAVNYRLTSNSVLKAEHHWRTGYAFDQSVPVVKSQTATEVTMAPAQKTNYFLVSLAASF